MTNPSTLLSALQAAGFVLRMDGTQLVVSPASKLTQQQRADIATHKPGLLELLDETMVAERDRLLADIEPDWDAGPAQLLEVAIVEIGGVKAAWRREEWEQALARIAAHNQASRERWEKSQAVPVARTRPQKVAAGPGLFGAGGAK